jgi:hypothetical protein
MKSIALATLLLVAVSTVSMAQDSTRLERYEYVIGSSLAFSMFDYLGFNYLVRTVNTSPIVYHIIQGAVQAAISYFLYEQLGLTSAISFNLLWWSWCDDLAYFGWANVLNSFSWEDRTENGFRFHQMASAGFTPIGLLRAPHSYIARDALIAQAAVGLSVSMAILW